MENMQKQQRARDVSALPIRLVREGEVWKIAYASLGGLLEGF